MITLRDKRERLGHSQEQLAASAGVSRGTVQRAEAGAVISRTKALAIARALGVKIEEIKEFQVTYTKEVSTWQEHIGQIAAINHEHQTLWVEDMPLTASKALMAQIKAHFPLGKQVKVTFDPEGELKSIVGLEPKRETSRRKGERATQC